MANFKQRYGPERVTSAPSQSAYTQVYLWRQAVEQAQPDGQFRIVQSSPGRIQPLP